MNFNGMDITMDFSSLAGNAALKARLRSALRAGTLPHACIISGAHGGGKHTLARLLAAAAVCSGEGEPPCGLCRDCRKVFSGVHPDVVTVSREKGKRFYAVDRIRELAADAQIRPNEAARKVYIVENADFLTVPCQNAALKLLEEPPLYAVFLLLAEETGVFLDTLRSRCVEYALGAVPEPELCALLRARAPEASGEAIQSAARRSGGYAGAALELLSGGGEAGGLPERFIETFLKGGPLETAAEAAGLESLDRESFRAFLEELTERSVAALRPERGLSARERERLFGLCGLAERLLEMAGANVGSAMLSGALAAGCNTMK